MAGDTLKELFFKIGYKINTDEQAKFESALTSATTKGVLLGETLVGAAKEAGSYFVRLAGHMEQLYFASRRTGATAAGIMDFSLAIQNAGGSAEGAVAQLEALAQFVNTDFNAAGKLLSMGVKKEDLHDPINMMKDMVNHAHELHQTFAQFYNLLQGQNIPFTYDNAFAMFTGQFKEEHTAEDFKAKYGIDYDDAVKKEHEFMNQMRDAALVISVEMIPSISLVSDKMTGLAKTVNDALLGIMGGQPDSNFTPDPVAGGWDSTKSLPHNIAKMIDKIDPFYHPSKIQKHNTDEAMKYFVGQGWSPDESAAMTAQILSEDAGFDPHIVNIDKKGGIHTGLGQWDATRDAQFRHLKGHNLSEATVAEELWFMDWELKNDPKYASFKGLGAVKGADYLNKVYERSGEDAAGYKKREDNAANLLKEFNQTVNLTINAPNSNPQAIAGAVTSALNRNNQGVVQ